MRKHLPGTTAVRACGAVVALVTIASLVTLTSCHREPQPNVLIVTVDSLRADRLGVYGNQRGITPFLDSLAARGTVFVNAYAPSSSTSASVASLLTSRDPRQHTVGALGASLPPGEQTFAGIPFKIADPSANGRRTAIGVSAANKGLPARAVLLRAMCAR